MRAAFDWSKDDTIFRLTFRIIIKTNKFTKTSPKY